MTNSENSERKQWDKEQILRALPWCEYLCEKHSVVMKRVGVGRLIGLCPFHHERTGSFMVRPDAKEGGTWHCFGCGAGGDAFALYAEFEGLDLKTDWWQILESMAGMAGLAPAGTGGKKWKRRTCGSTSLPPPPCETDNPVAVPPLRPLALETIEELARLRGLSSEAVAAAAAAGRVRGLVLGVSERFGLCWGDEMWRERDRLRIGPVRCWVVTDNMRLVAQARRLDGRPWTRPDGSEFKAWTMGTARWALGARDAGGKGCVALVEGGPDMLAAYEFLSHTGRLDDVAVVALLGASVRIRQDARLWLEGKRVRIFPHHDRLDMKTGMRAGDAAAQRWVLQLDAPENDLADIWPLDPPEVLEHYGDGYGETWDLNDAAKDRGLLYEWARMGFLPETDFVERAAGTPHTWPDWLAG